MCLVEKSLNLLLGEYGRKAET